MKQIILTTTLFVLSYVALAQCDEKAFNKLMNDAQTAETNNDYQKAVNKYTAAIIICPDRAEEAQQKIVGVFKKIERLKDDAQQAEIKATALLAKSKELTKAFLPEGKKDLKVWQYFGTKADSAFALGEYAEADKNYKLAKNDPDLPPKNDIETRLKTNLECWEWQKKAISDLEKQNLAEAEKNILKNLTLNPNNRKDIIIASAINPLLGLVLVQGGTFLMGNPDETIENSRNERPVHTVTLSSFEMSRYEVTNMYHANHQIF
jgi:tetratricopeptide (TPR) repeat protein